ncbi:energy-coupling factor transporter transmembrane protein EcfT [Lactobacillus sp. LC28-10]|uniref:Energy-coupling factor transporter transmembrane protein EcfT n=1 Tax=Secundilactobacillus angelensis TaxID=2722706 RepID=A0ABX1KYH9_9LACO|nr:energy-coupling factor transporter transmembrane component T [Secundilactobacillus angelensis]MCH5463442.1 energy-coupling factor transporter transmembrane protein EcfT [Secundilactobacillus angelensis]NLR18335.1 energy-coupling factor transporter transmembrane protein EcfT [Secundilactobacillus angelensis]
MEIRDNSIQRIAQMHWYNFVDPVTKLLLALFLTMLSFDFTNLYFEAGLVLFSLMLLLLSRLSSATINAVSFCLFLIATMVLIQGLFYSGNIHPLFSVMRITFYREGFLYALTMSARILIIIFAIGFFMSTTTVSENAKYLESIGMPYKLVYLLMSVCYILPQIQQNMKKIQFAERARGINPQKTVTQKVRSILPILIPLIIKTFDQSINRSITLQLRGFDSPSRTLATPKYRYFQTKLSHYLLTLVTILLIGWKLWQIISKFL